MNKIDFVSKDKKFYQPKTEPEIVEVPTMQFLMFDGEGAPENNPSFREAFTALYGVAYSIKFMPKRGLLPFGYEEFKVPPPEGLWWMAGGKSFDTSRPEDWRWTLMLRMPEFVTHELVNQVAGELVARKNNDVYWRVRLDTLKEGASVQLMHFGPYEDEGADLASMEAYAHAAGYQYTGKHHEIYFGDPRRTTPSKLKTVLRHPVTTPGG